MPAFRTFLRFTTMTFLTGYTACAVFSCSDSQLFAASTTDDFADGAWDDGAPIEWSIVDGNSSSVSINSENTLRLDSSSGLIRIGVPVAPPEFPSDTASIRVEGRVVSSFLGLSFPNQGHWTALDSDGRLFIGMGDNTVLDSATPALDPLSKDVVVQMDWIGDTISAWAWHPDNPPTTEEPHAQYVTTRTRSFPTIFTNSNAIAEYDSITISNKHISVVPEPNSLTLLCFGILSLGLAQKRRYGRKSGS